MVNPLKDTSQGHWLTTLTNYRNHKVFLSFGYRIAYIYHLLWITMRPCGSTVGDVLLWQCSYDTVRGRQLRTWIVLSMTEWNPKIHAIYTCSCYLYLLCTTVITSNTFNYTSYSPLVFHLVWITQTSWKSHNSSIYQFTNRILGALQRNGLCRNHHYQFWCHTPIYDPHPFPLHDQGGCRDLLYLKFI